jgi:hypothetical protein
MEEDGRIQGGKKPNTAEDVQIEGMILVSLLQVCLICSFFCFGKALHFGKFFYCVTSLST